MLEGFRAWWGRAARTIIKGDPFLDAVAAAHETGAKRMRQQVIAGQRSRIASQIEKQLEASFLPLPASPEVLAELNGIETPVEQKSDGMLIGGYARFNQLFDSAAAKDRERWHQAHPEAMQTIEEQEQVRAGQIRQLEEMEDERRLLQNAIDDVTAREAMAARNAVDTQPRQPRVVPTETPTIPMPIRAPQTVRRQTVLPSALPTTPRIEVPENAVNTTPQAPHQIPVYTADAMATTPLLPQ